MESLEHECTGWPPEVDNDQLRAKQSSKLILLQLHKRLQRTQHLPSTAVQHLKQIGSVKKLSKRVPCELTRNLKKNHCLKCHLLLLYANNTPFLDQTVTCNKKWILYDNWWRPAQWLDWEEAPKPKLQRRRVSAGWSAACLIHYSFLNPGKIITSEKYAQQIDEMHQKLQCLQLVLVNKKGPILFHNIQLHVVQHFKKLNELGYKVLPPPSYSPDLSPNDYHFFKHLDNFLQGKTLPQPAGGRKCFPWVRWILRHGFLCYRNKLTYFSLTKICWL